MSTARPAPVQRSRHRPGNLDTGEPSTISRFGTLTPIGSHRRPPGGGRAGESHLVPRTDHRPARPLAGGPFDVTEVIPVGARHRDARLSQYATNEWTPTGGFFRPTSGRSRGRRSIRAIHVTVHHFDDIGNATNYEYAADPNSSCTGTSSASRKTVEPGRTQSARRRLGHRVRVGSHQGPHVRQAPGRLVEHVQLLRTGRDDLRDARRDTAAARRAPNGTATLHTRFVAKIVTDNTDPSTLQLRRLQRSETADRRDHPHADPGERRPARALRRREQRPERRHRVVAVGLRRRHDEHRPVPRPQVRRQRHVHRDAHGHRRDRQHATRRPSTRPC